MVLIPKTLDDYLAMNGVCIYRHVLCMHMRGIERLGNVMYHISKFSAVIKDLVIWSWGLH